MPLLKFTKAQATRLQPRVPDAIISAWPEDWQPDALELLQSSDFQPLDKLLLVTRTALIPIPEKAQETLNPYAWPHPKYIIRYLGYTPRPWLPLDVFAMLTAHLPLPWCDIANTLGHADWAAYVWFATNNLVDEAMKDALAGYDYDPDPFTGWIPPEARSARREAADEAAQRVVDLLIQCICDHYEEEELC